MLGQWAQMHLQTESLETASRRTKEEEEEEESKEQWSSCHSPRVHQHPPEPHEAIPTLLPRKVRWTEGLQSVESLHRFKGME